MHEQVIYFGAPGTGKSHIVKENLNTTNNNKIFRVTIHPEFTYSDFIGQLLPEENLQTGAIEFPFKEGPFTRALIEAYNNFTEDVYLVLEELSRGNVAAIFGDVFQLLDRDEHFVSKYPIINKNISDKIVQLPTDEVVLPSNFNIIGTVNVNDQNVFPMDTAFKRRFDWKYVSSKPAVDSNNNVITTLNNPKLIIQTKLSNDIETNWQSFYTALNDFITNKEVGLGKNEDKQVGQFFINFNNSLISDSHSNNATTANQAAVSINNIIKNKLLLYLWQDVQGTSSFGNSAKIFNSNISSYEDLYSKFGVDTVFSEVFTEEFLRPHFNRYPF